MKNITPDNITVLKEHEIFVFGSNLSGRHGKGAALQALKKFGAVYGQSYGLQGQSFAIPTVNATITKRLNLDSIEQYVTDFLLFVKETQNLVFYVTKIGCGLAGYKEKDIAPMFMLSDIPYKYNNIYLPKEFWDWEDEREKYMESFQMD